MENLEEGIKTALTCVGKEDLVPKNFQKEVINSYINNKDCFCVAPTGSGKSLTYIIAPFMFELLKNPKVQLCTDNLTTVAIIIQPLVSLMKEQVTKMNSLGVKAIYIGDKENNIDLIKQGHFNIIIGSPESITSAKFEEILHHLKDKLKVIFIDESHCIKTL